MTRIIAVAALLALPAVARSEVRNQGMVKSHLWTSTAGLENARTALRALTALANDATAWDETHARDLLKEAESGVDFARTHERHLKQFTTKDTAKDLAQLDSDLSGARTLLGKLQGPIARGVGPNNDDTQADNTLLGGAASDRGLPPGKGGDVTYDSGRGQRGGTKAVQRLRDDIKAAWDRLDDARKDLDKLAGDYDTTTKLPEP
jgi:hypothetical protein